MDVFVLKAFSFLIGIFELYM